MKNSYNSQLFRKPLTKELLTIIKDIYQIKNLNNHTFDKKIKNYNIIEQLELYHFYISDFYLPCKEKYF